MVHRPSVSIFIVNNGMHEPAVLLLRAQLILSEWVVDHTTKSDRRLGHYLQNTKETRAMKG